MTKYVILTRAKYKRHELNISLSLLGHYFHSKTFVLPPMIYPKGYKVSNKCSTWSRNLIYVRSNGANLSGSVLKYHLNINCPREQIHLKPKRPYYTYHFAKIAFH